MPQVTVDRTSAASVGYDNAWGTWYRLPSTVVTVGCQTYDTKFNTPDIRRGYFRFDLPPSPWDARVIDKAVFGAYLASNVGTNTCTLRQSSAEVNPAVDDIATVFNNANGTSIGTISENVGWNSVDATTHARNHKGGFCDFGLTGSGTSIENYDSWYDITWIPRLVIDYYTPVNGRAQADDAEFVIAYQSYAGYDVHFRRNAGSGYKLSMYSDDNDYYVQLYKMTSGSWSQIGSNVAFNYGATSLKLRAEGSSIKVYEGSNQTATYEWTDTTYTGVGDWFTEGLTETSYSEITAGSNITVTTSTAVTDTVEVSAETAPVETPVVNLGSSTAVTDQVNALVTSFTVTAQDSTTVTDQVSALLPFLNTSVDDTSTVTDQATMLVPALNTDRTDTTAVTDTVTLVVPALNVSTSSSTAVTDEATALIKEFVLSVSDTTVTSDSTTMLIPVVYLDTTSPLEVTDQASLSTDGQPIGETYEINISPDNPLCYREVV